MAILEVKGVGKRFGGLHALSDVNLSVQENTVHAIIGPNGAGKSTLLHCLVGKLMRTHCPAGQSAADPWRDLAGPPAAALHGRP